MAYTGTHDNDTTLGWWTTLDAQAKECVTALLSEDEAPVKGLVRLAIESRANMAMIPLQDLLGLGTTARMNTPGTAEGNWKWSFSWKDLNTLHFSSP